MVGQGIDASALANIPQLNEGVVAASDNMGLGLLGHNGSHCMRVSHQSVHLLADTDIPNPCSTVSPSRYEHVKPLMDLHAVDSTEMSVIVPDDFVHFQVPAFDRFVLPTSKKIGMLLRKFEGSNSVDVASERYLELARGQVPKLYGPVCRPSRKVSVTGRNSDAPHPSVVASDDSIQFERSMPFWLDQLAEGGGSNRAQPCGFCQIHLKLLGEHEGVGSFTLLLMADVFLKLGE